MQKDEFETFRLMVPKDEANSVLEQLPSGWFASKWEETTQRRTTQKKTPSYKVIRMQGFAIVLGHLASVDFAYLADLQQKFSEHGLESRGASSELTRLVSKKLVERMSAGKYKITAAGRKEIEKSTEIQNGISFVNRKGMVDKTIRYLKEQNGPVSTKQLAAAMDMPYSSARSRFLKLRLLKVVKRVSPGVFELANGAAHA